MKKFLKFLSGGDLRSIGKSSEAVALVNSQVDFDDLFGFMYDTDRKVVMRAADAVEKVTADKHHFIHKHKLRLVQLSQTAVYKELKWHLALLLPRLTLNKDELAIVWDILSE